MWRVADYIYDFPPELIAQSPASRRDGSRLLRVLPGAAPPEQTELIDAHFAELPALLPPEAVLVVNDTRVIPARLRGRKPSGGAVELLLVEPAEPDREDGPWLAMARASKPLRAGAEIDLTDAAGHPAEPPARARIAGPRRDHGLVAVELSEPAFDLCARLGDVPLPPYIERDRGVAEPGDRERYQTVYARAPGAVAAPTAGLHFTPALLAALDARGVTRAPLTLHVGLGTFAPVRVESLRDHRMHRERYDIPAETARLVSSGRPVVAVGTTCVRALEAAALGPRRVAPGPGSTDLFIGPDHQFRAVDHLITNFHLPGSTLMVLVSAFAGHPRLMNAYRHAVASRYRFYSYGDAMLLSCAAPPPPVSPAPSSAATP